MCGLGWSEGGTCRGEEERVSRRWWSLSRTLKEEGVLTRRGGPWGNPDRLGGGRAQTVEGKGCVLSYLVRATCALSKIPGCLSFTYVCLNNLYNYILSLT